MGEAKRVWVLKECGVAWKQEMYEELVDVNEERREGR